MWAAIPAAALLAVCGVWTLASRKAQLRDWDVATSPSDPSVVPIVIRLAVFAGVLWLAFCVYNWYLRDQIAPKQIMFNIGAWLIGSILGTALGFLLGLRLAEPRRLI